MDDFHEEGSRNTEKLKQLVGLAEGYEKRVKEETELTKEQLKTRYVGKIDPKKRTATHLFRSIFLSRLTVNPDLEDVAQQLIEDNIVSVSRQMIDKEASVAKTSGTNRHQNGSMDVDEEL